MRKALWILTALPIIATAFVLQFMPDRIPAHYDFSGEIDRWGSKYELRQHRIIIVVRLRSQIFRQIVQIERRWADAHQAKFVQDDGKYASKRAAKALAVNCAVLP